MFCNSQSDLVITFFSLLDFARIILNLLEPYALDINSAAVVYNYSRFCRSSFNGELFIELLLLEVLNVVLSYLVKISWH